MSGGCCVVAIQTDSDSDTESLQCFEHRAVQEGAVGLNEDPHLSRYAAAQQLDQLGNPVRPG